MSNQQTLARAATVEQLLSQHGVDVDDLVIHTRDGRCHIEVDLSSSAIDPERAPVDPSKIGGGTIKTTRE